ncbi:hypothetical protein HG536_0G04140 [Torulaspora globosa]|uniref:Aminotransferase class I/classII large domain-containing protein n=1 Tax=Torulaspora globosa TaxID=48254 RepID=A0A7G3ZM16_9SACH|nr:uncharacterized protein HG536_0G04140 [Torulaspora globosa]QLL34552.1 hypothetical protein HG536_0G04140 [Torulaspora globosa]
MDYDRLKERYSKFLSKRDERRELVSFWDGDLPSKDLICLEAGMPNEKLFPIKAIDLHLVDQPFDDGDGDKVSITRYEQPAEMPIARAFQYSEVRGMLPMVSFCKRIVEMTNRPVYDNWDVLLSNGSSDSMFKVFETLCDESSTVLMEEFTFSPVVSNVTSTGASCVPLKMHLTTDPRDQGIDVEYMEQLLDNWHELEEYKRLNKPKLLYTIVTGQNPTGMTLSMQKRQQIYRLAQKHDLIIVEDDPYGYLTFPPYDPENPMKNVYTDTENPMSIDEYLQKRLIKSFLTLDTDARVIRLETFSKMYAPGLRLSFIVANKFIIDRLLNLSEITTRAPSGASQAIVYATVKAMAARETAYQDEQDRMFYGWIRWAMKLAGTYTHRRNVAFKALYETDAYKSHLFSVLEPSAGMFINVKINWPHAPPDDMRRSLDQLDTVLVKNGVKVVLGYKLAVDQSFSIDSSGFLRFTVAYASHDEQLIEGCHRIGNGIQEFLGY